MLEGEGSVITTRTTAEKVKVDCQKEGTSVGSTTFAGGNQSSFRPGTSPLHPSFLEFRSGSEALEGEGSKGTVMTQTEGSVKTLGFDEQELVTVR